MTTPMATIEDIILDRDRRGISALRTHLPDDFCGQAARLILDNFPNIKSYWVMIGEETASISLNFGANDMDGTIGEERIAHAAKAASPLGLARQRMVRLIRDAGQVPVERNALYEVVKVYDN